MSAVMLTNCITHLRTAFGFFAQPLGYTYVPVPGIWTDSFNEFVSNKYLAIDVITKRSRDLTKISIETCVIQC